MSEVLKSVCGVELRKLNRPDGRQYTYSVCGQGKPIKEKNFDNLKDAEIYFEEVINSPEIQRLIHNKLF